MIPPLSERLRLCFQMIRPGDRVADIGCDHGYLGIHLLLSGKASSVIAADINAQPLQCARDNAAACGVSSGIQFYLSDGTRDIPRDFDTMVCAGMGAVTIISILRAAPWLRDPRYRLVLQCQTQRRELRQWLSENGFRILREEPVRDGGFLYTVMEVSFAPGAPVPVGQYYISAPLLSCGIPLLPEFFARVRHGVAQTVEGLTACGHEPEKLQRFREILAQLDEMEVQIRDNCR